MFGKQSLLILVEDMVFHECAFVQDHLWVVL